MKILTIHLWNQMRPSSSFWTQQDISVMDISCTCSYFFSRDCVGEIHEPQVLPEIYHKLLKHHHTWLSLQ